MAEIGVADISALLEPSATRSTTIELAGFRAGAALGTCRHGTVWRCDGHRLDSCFGRIERWAMINNTSRQKLCHATGRSYIQSTVNLLLQA